MKLTPESIRAVGIYLGRMLNNWRQRSVAIYAIPEGNGASVWTIGQPFKGGSPICCEEPVRPYANAIRASKRLRFEVCGPTARG